MNNRTLSVLRDRLDMLDKDDLDILSTEVKECLKFKEFKENGGCSNCGYQSCLGNYPYGHHCSKFQNYVKYPPLAIGDLVEVRIFTSNEGDTLYRHGRIILSSDKEEFDADRAIEEFGANDEYCIAIETYGGPYKIKRNRRDIRKL